MIAFGKQSGYESITLWTVSALTAAAHLYRSFGFRKVEESQAGSGGWTWWRRSRS